MKTVGFNCHFAIEYFTFSVALPWSFGLKGMLSSFYHGLFLVSLLPREIFRLGKNFTGRHMENLAASVEIL